MIKTNNLCRLHAGLELPLENIHACDNNPEESPTAKISKHTAYGYFSFTCCSSDSSRIKQNFDREADCMKKFRVDLKRHAIKIINHEKK